MPRKSHIPILIILLSSFFFLSACSSSDPSNSEAKAEKKEEDKYEKLVKEKNKELELEPLELTSYSEEVGAALGNPEYKEFAAMARWLYKERLRSILT